MDTFRACIGRMSYSNSDLADTAMYAWTHVAHKHALAKAIMEENQQLTQKVMDSDARVIALQSELLASKDAQLKAVTSTVETAVKDSLETSFSQVTAANSQNAQSQSVVSPAVIQRAVRDIAEREERSKNLLVFGLEETADEDMRAKVCEVFDTLGDKPLLEEVSRLGKKRTSHHRPVIVKLRTSAAANGVLKKSQV